MRGAGVSSGCLVVAYDDWDATAAARAWWTLRFFGHSAVQVLDVGHPGQLRSPRWATEATAAARAGPVHSARSGSAWLPVVCR